MFRKGVLFDKKKVKHDYTFFVLCLKSELFIATSYNWGIFLGLGYQGHYPRTEETNYLRSLLDINFPVLALFEIVPYIYHSKICTPLFVGSATVPKI